MFTCECFTCNAFHGIFSVKRGGADVRIGFMSWSDTKNGGWGGGEVQETMQEFCDYEFVDLFNIVVRSLSYCHTILQAKKR